MGIKINNKLAGLQNRLAKVDDGNMTNVIADALTEQGKEIATAMYLGTKVEVERTEVVDGEASITATGKGIAYMEYGTGETGRGTYEGELPTRELTFVSPKDKRIPLSQRIHTTQGWVYNYDNKYTKILGGWFFGNTFTTGQPANAQMFKTARELRNEYAKIAKSALKGD